MQKMMDDIFSEVQLDNTQVSYISLSLLKKGFPMVYDLLPYHETDKN